MDEALHEGRFYEKLPDQKVFCFLCPHDCHIPESGRGACGVRYNRHGILYTLTYDKIISSQVDPVEKKPLFHFFSGTNAYSIATAGCNLRCEFCQNWFISQWPKESLPKRIKTSQGALEEPVCAELLALQRDMPGEYASPDSIVKAALDAEARSIAYTYTEPTIFYELAYDTAVLARQHGLKNIFVTNGFISKAPLQQLATVLDAANVDLKFFKEESYRRISRARLAPILDAIRLYHELGVWLEITTLVIPGLNDSLEELKGIAEFIASVNIDIPWHISQFYPAYKMLGVPPTPIETLRQARALGRAAGLHYVYLGNVPGDPGENTYCPSCNRLLIERYGVYVRANHIRGGRCPDCGTTIVGRGMAEERLRA